MKALSIFLFKQYWSFILICLLGTGVAIKLGGLWNFIPFLMLLLFFYEWNIAPRKERTWYFIETLPITFNIRYLLRVIAPFIFGLLIIFTITYFKKDYENSLIQSLTDALRISALFTLSSILAQSMSGFIAWFIFVYFVCYLCSSISFYEIATLIICLSSSYYVLSEKRVSKFKTVYLPIILSVALLSLTSVFKIKIYEFSLRVPIHSLQLMVADALLDNKAFLSKNFVVDWSLNNNDGMSGYSKILIPAKYDDVLLEKIETIYLQEKVCTESCYKLANLVSNFPQNWNLERLEQYLNSNNTAQQIYALQILDGALSPLFYNRVLQLTKSENDEVAMLAINLARKWEVFDVTTNPLNSIY